MNKKILNSKLVKASLVIFVIGIVATIAAGCIMNYVCKTNAISAEVIEIVPAVEDEDFAIGVIKSEDGNDDLVVIDSENGNEVIVPIAITEIVEAQDADEMRGGITVYRNGLGELTGAKLFVPEDAVMREYIK